MKLKNVLLVILFFTLSLQRSFANLSELDRWNYIKSLIEDRIKFSQNLIEEISTQIESEELLEEKYNLIASLTGENYLFFQNLIRQAQQAGDISHGISLLPVINFELILYDLVPWLSFPKRMARGEDSFGELFMQRKLVQLNQALSDLKVNSQEEVSHLPVDSAIVMTLYLQVNQRISIVCGMKKRREGDLLQDKILRLLEDEIVQHNLSFLKILRKHFFELLNVTQRRYLSKLKKSELLDFSAFSNILKESSSKIKKLKTSDQALGKELYALYERVKFELERKLQENQDPNLTRLLLFRVNKHQAIHDAHYFKKIFLPILEKKSEFFDDLIREKFKQLSHSLDRFIENSEIRDRLTLSCLNSLIKVMEINTEISERLKEYEIIPFDLNSRGVENFLISENRKQELIDFGFYTKAKIVPSLLLLIDKLESLENEVNSLRLEVIDLKKIIKRSNSLRRSPPHSVKEENLKPSFELSKAATSPMALGSSETNLTTAQVNPIHEKGIKIGPKELTLVPQKLDSQDTGGLESEFFGQLESLTGIDSIEEGATIFAQSAQDKYHSYIQSKMKGRYRDLLESLYSYEARGIRFETLQNLVERCGGILRFDGRGSSHFHMTLPGGYTGRSWRLHGSAHTPKIERRALEGFRDALSGVADILGITLSRDSLR